jgi:hypothetical protein
MKFKQYIWVLLAAAVIGVGLGGASIGITHLVKNQGTKQAQQTSQTKPSTTSAVKTTTQSTGTTTTATTSSQTALPSGQGALPSGLGTTGTVQTFDGSILTLKTSSVNLISVTVGSNTWIQKTILVAVSDIVAGSNIMVSGTQQSDGSISASNISITTSSAQVTPPASLPSSLVPLVPGAFPSTGNSTAGTVQSVDSNIVNIKIRDGSSVRIVVSSNTVIQKTIAGTLADILIGSSITVAGSQQSDGSLLANMIIINANSQN